MSHVKSAGGKVFQGPSTPGKHLGLKVGNKQPVKPGMILVTQKGTKYYAGVGTKLCKNYSIMAKITGIVNFSTITRPLGQRKLLSILSNDKATNIKVKTKVAKAETKTESKITESKAEKTKTEK